MNFSDKSYNSHEQHYKNFKGNSLEVELQSIEEGRTLDSWLNKMKYDSIVPLLNEFSDEKWVTIGDGKYGRDALMLKSMTSSNVDILPTDISPFLLEKAKSAKAINDFAVINAEKMDLKDDSFGVSFCKESYHHFPRPYMALYEMVRISKKAIILIEPFDQFPKNIFQKIVGLFKKRMEEFETSGNFIYTPSKNELYKFCSALQLPLFAIKSMNGHWENGYQYKNMDEHKFQFFKLRFIVGLKNILTKIGYKKPGKVAIVIFKNEPSEQLKKQLLIKGYKMFKTPKNPYL